MKGWIWGWSKYQFNKSQCAGGGAKRGLEAGATRWSLWCLYSVLQQRVILKPLSDNGRIKSIPICQMGKDHPTHCFPPTCNPQTRTQDLEYYFVPKHKSQVPESFPPNINNKPPKVNVINTSNLSKVCRDTRWRNDHLLQKSQFSTAVWRRAHPASHTHTHV